MARRSIDPDEPARDEDWEGNDAAFTCPKCGKVFLVSGQLHAQVRKCPACGRATGFVSSGRKSGGQAYIEVVRPVQLGCLGC